MINMVPKNVKFPVGTVVMHSVTGEEFSVSDIRYDMFKGIWFYDLSNHNGMLSEPQNAVEQNYVTVVQLPAGAFTAPINLNPYVGTTEHDQNKFDDESPGNWRPSYGVPYGQCNHEWARYTGFTNSYDYCKKCNEEKSI